MRIAQSNKLFISSQALPENVFLITKDRGRMNIGIVIWEIKKGLTHFITWVDGEKGKESYEFLNKRWKKQGKSVKFTPCYLYGFGLTLSLIVFRFAHSLAPSTFEWFTIVNFVFMGFCHCLISLLRSLGIFVHLNFTFYGFSHQ